jgi:hypothetical protein
MKEAVLFLLEQVRKNAADPVIETRSRNLITKVSEELDLGALKFDVTPAGLVPESGVTGAVADATGTV